MSRVVLMTPADLKIPIYDQTVNIEMLTLGLAQGPTIPGEWGASVTLSPHHYKLAGGGDKESVKRIIDFLEIKQELVCVNLKDVTYDPAEGVIAYVEGAGPQRSRYEEESKADNIRFIPRYWLDKHGRLRIKTWDVSYK